MSYVSKRFRTFRRPINRKPKTGWSYSFNIPMLSDADYYKAAQRMVAALKDLPA